MKSSILKTWFFLLGGLFSIVSCDKIDHVYKTNTGGSAIGTSGLDTNLYPGNWSNYVSTEWPTFTPNTNTNLNVLVEDYTGHKCPNCPAGATIAEQLEATHPGRVFVASIHAGPSATGITAFQETDAEFPQDFTNPDGLAYAIFFANGYGFVGNPRGTVNRKYGSTMFMNPNDWTSNTINTLDSNVLRVNIQSKVNYYSETRGMFLHIEVEAKQDLPSTARAVVYFIQDSLIAPQKDGASTITDYHHHNIHRCNIDGKPWGSPILAGDSSLVSGQKAYLNYSYKIPTEYDPAGCHLLIYVSDDATKEIYQVIEQSIP